MKKFSRTMAFILLGGSTLLTSCVSEDISPEVEQLRQAQVTYLQAKAAMEQAKADNEAAQTALIQVEIDYQQAVMQAKVDGEIADMEAQVAAAKQRAAEAEYALQQAIDNLAAQVNETAQEYLEMYQNTMTQANTKMEAIVNLEGDVARYNAYLDAGGNIMDFDRVAAELKAQITEDSTQIIALEASIERLEALNSDAASVEEELNAVMTELDQLSAAKATAELEVNLAENKFYEIDEDFSDAYDLENYFIPALEQDIATTEEDLANAQSEIASLQTQLASFQAELDAAEVNFLPAVEQAESLLETWIQARSSFDAIAINHSAGDEEYDTAEQDLADAKAAFEAYAGTGYGTDPQQIKDNDNLVTFADPATEFGAIVTQYTNVLYDSTFQDLKWRLIDAYNEVDNINYGYWSPFDGLIFMKEQLNTMNNYLEATFEKYEAADLAELESKRYDSQVNYVKSEQAYYQVSSEFYALEDLKWTLQYYLDGNPSQLEYRIDNLTWEIASLESNIEDSKGALANNEINAEEWAAAIVRAEEKLDRMTTEYDALLALANDYLEQFNDVVEN